MRRGRGGQFSAMYLKLRLPAGRENESENKTACCIASKASRYMHEIITFDEILFSIAPEVYAVLGDRCE